MNEEMQKALSACLEPVVDAVVAIERRIDGLTLKEGPQGPQGEPGKDAAPVDLVELVKSLRDALSGSADLVNAMAERIVTFLKADPIFLMHTVGKDGENANPAEVAKALAADADFVKAVTPPGTPVDKVVEALKSDPVFLHDITGKPGEPGRDGANGQDGAGIQCEQYKTGDVYRLGDVVTAFCGQYFEAKRDTADAPGSDAWERIGCAGFRFIGVKPDDDTLKQGDLYIDGGSLFHFDGERARMWVQRGKTGPQGDKGENGRNGRDGTDAPRVIAIEGTAKGLAFAFDSGQIIDADIAGLDAFIAEQVAKKIEEYESPPDDETVIVRSFRGDHGERKQYRPGDVVRAGGLLLLCCSPTKGAITDRAWIKWGTA